MADESFVGDIYFEREGGTPGTFARICQVFSISGLGETNDIVDATTFCSNGNREYIAGLADGSEVTIECNYNQANADLLALINDVKSRAVKNYRLVVENTTPHEHFLFAATSISWGLNPSVDDKNTITFTFKISGGITIANAAS